MNPLIKEALKDLAAKGSEDMMMTKSYQKMIRIYAIFIVGMGMTIVALTWYLNSFSVPDWFFPALMYGIFCTYIGYNMGHHNGYWAGFHHDGIQSLLNRGGEEE